MRALRIIMCIVFIGTCIAYYMLMREMREKTDTTIPVITCKEEILSVNIDDKNALLSGITAIDEKDGEITDRVIIESISKFIEKGISNITYAVSDKDNHVVKHVRKIKYNDYHSPHFTLNGELCFNVGQNIKIQDYLGAYDCLDGDISEKIKYTSGYADTQIPGVYHINVQVSNSKGDVSYLEFDVMVKERLSRNPSIELNEYILYIKKGTYIEEREYIKSVKKYDGGSVINVDDVATTTNLDTEKNGIYTINYYIEDGAYFDEATLICIVE